MLFNCRPVSFSAPFSLSDSVSDDPGPWHRTARENFRLYDDPAGGVLLTSGTGTITHSTITMSASTVIGNAVDVIVESGWSAGSNFNESVVTAQIDQFDGFLSTTATHSVPIDGTYSPRAFVEANAWGEYGGFPFVPFSVTSGQLLDDWNGLRRVHCLPGGANLQRSRAVPVFPGGNARCLRLQRLQLRGRPRPRRHRQPRAAHHPASFSASRPTPARAS